MADSCAFLGCTEVLACPLPGGCVIRRYPPSPRQLIERDQSLKDDAKALNGTKPRAVRDPRLIQRKRKALTP